MADANKSNESTPFWERSGRHPDLDYSGNPDLNCRSLLVEILVLAEVCAL